MRMPTGFLGIPTLLTMLASAAQAGVVLEYTTRELPSGRTQSVERYYAQDGMMRIESVDAATGAVDHVHLVRDGVIYDIEPRRHTYQRIDPQTMKSVMGAQNERMQAMLAQLPPERRAMMQERLARLQSGEEAGPSVSYIDTGRSDHAASYACRLWTEQRAGHPTAEICVTSFSSVPGGAEFGTSMKNAFDTARGISASVPQAARAAQDIARFGKMNGVPVRTRHLATNGDAERETDLSASRTQSLSADQFAVPAGYTEKAFGRAASD